MMIGFGVSGVLFLIFGVLLGLVLKVNVQAIGPEGSVIGLATLNGYMHELIGVHIIWYHITEWFGLVAILTAFGFAVVGLVQVVKEKSLFRVEKSLIWLGGYFVLVIGIYIFFEKYVINYRPIMLSEYLEPSFPSTHTMIVLCIMGAAMIQFQRRIKNQKVRYAAHILSVLTIAVTVIGRMISGVHWFTDIIAGLLIGTAMLFLYYAVDLLICQFLPDFQRCKSNEQNC
ncbi:MAG: phosphatase PAP2 family protein [Lachnospiraceae bacterium]|nr:phosphatase PAP2 family protein [Lachnospiraceae bacterium]